MAVPPTASRSLLDVTAPLLRELHDVVEERPQPSTQSSQTPASLRARGWDDFLTSLTDDELDAMESADADAALPPRCPDSLRRVIADARQAVHVDAAGVTAEGARQRHVTPRKSVQIDAVARAVSKASSGATRVVDVGSGHGHLTRALADHLGRDVVGLERNATLAARARALANGVTFDVRDVLADGLPISRGDIVVGLHACGEIGDAIVRAAAAVGASVVYVGCCLQKQRAPRREPLSHAGSAALPHALHKGVLGLSNLVGRNDGVEASRRENLAARERRLALYGLLAARTSLRFGQEIEGINRRRAHDPLPALVAHAFAHRGLVAPSRREIDDASAWAAVEAARLRRFAVPRSSLARVLEMFVVADRACFLEESGHTTQISEAFPAAISPRNVMLVGAHEQ